jgi:hypothetical protein
VWRLTRLEIPLAIGARTLGKPSTWQVRTYHLDGHAVSAFGRLDRSERL